MDDVGLYAEKGVNAEVPNIFGGVEKVPEGEDSFSLSMYLFITLLEHSFSLSMYLFIQFKHDPYTIIQFFVP